MPVLSPPRPTISDDEISRVVALEHELERALPDVDEATIRRCVGRVWAGFRNARVRDFVPLLVRRQVVAELRPRQSSSRPESLN
jgi:hypothetical protein